MPAGWGRRARYGMQQFVTNVGTPAITVLANRPQFVALNPTDPLDSAASYTAGTTEPAVTGTYARQGVTWQLNGAGAYTGITADTSVIASNNGAISFGPSSAAFSPSGPYTFVSFFDVATLATVAEANYGGRAAVSAPTQSVAGAGITLTIASGALQMGCVTS